MTVVSYLSLNVSDYLICSVEKTCMLYDTIEVLMPFRKTAKRGVRVSHFNDGARKKTKNSGRDS